MSHARILSSYIALLCPGKSDFEAIDGFREDTYFAEALDLDQVSSEGTLCQRLGAHAAGYKIAVEEAAIEFLRRGGVHLTNRMSWRLRFTI